MDKKNVVSVYLEFNGSKQKLFDVVAEFTQVESTKEIPSTKFQGTTLASALYSQYKEAEAKKADDGKRHRVNKGCQLEVYGLLRAHPNTIYTSRVMYECLLRKFSIGAISTALSYLSTSKKVNKRKIAGKLTEFWVNQ